MERNQFLDFDFYSKSCVNGKSSDQTKSIGQGCDGIADHNFVGGRMIVIARSFISHRSGEWEKQEPRDQLGTVFILLHGWQPQEDFLFEGTFYYYVIAVWDTIGFGL